MAVHCPTTALLAAALFLIGGSASGANDASFADPAGDGNGGPDITNVTVSANDSGVLTFVVHSADPGAWNGWGADLLVDSDAHYSTGHGDGVDHVFSLKVDHTFSAGRWDGTAFPAYGSAATGSLDGGTLTITVPLSELGNTTKLAFAVVASTRNAVGDEAPDGSFAPGTPPRWQFSPQVAPHVVSITARFAPRSPVHGRRFAVTRVIAGLSTGGTRAAAASLCVARLSGTPLKGRCSWRIPFGGRGKRLIVTVSVEGVARRYAFAVR